LYISIKSRILSRPIESPHYGGPLLWRTTIEIVDLSSKTKLLGIGHEGHRGLGLITLPC